MPGVAHIFPTHNSGTFQLSFTLGSRSYAGVYDHEQLEEFLFTSATLDDSQIDDVLSEIQDHGSATISGVSVHENEMAMIGLREMPSDA